MNDTEIIMSEISEEITKGNGCVIFDFGCYFPYSNNLIFDFSLGMEKLTDKKLNHRYPNIGYHTISRKYGRRISKIGYPYFFDLDETNSNVTPWLLELKVGADLEDNAVCLIFPLSINVTSEKPVCALSLRYNFIEQHFTFESNYPSDDGAGWNSCYWTNDDEFVRGEANVILFKTPDRIENSSTLVYSNVITPVACETDKLLI